MNRKIFALLALFGLAASTFGASVSSGPIEGCAGSYNAEDKVFTASNLTYVALTKNDSANRNTTGWYTGLTISWENKDTGSSSSKAKVEGDHPVNEYTVYSLVGGGDQSKAGSGLKFTFQTNWGTSYLKTCTWWVYITAEDAYALNGADYEATLTVADETFKIVIPATTYNAGLVDSSGVQWFPAVALIGSKVYGDIDVALDAAGDVGMVVDAAVKSAHTLGDGAILRKNGKELSFEGGSIAATLGAKFDFEPTGLYDTATYKANGPDEDGLYTITYNHVCDWQYTGDGTAELTATCQTASECPYGKTLTVSLNIDDEVSYTGSAVSATKTVSEKFTEATSLTVGEITYWQGGAQLAGAPKYKGSYEVRLTVGSYTLKQAFAITHTGDWADGYSVVSTDVRYDTLPEAIAAAANGDTVKCWADDSKFTGFTADIGTKNVTLDLNGKTLSRDDNTAMTLTVNGTGTLTIRNGTIAQPYKSNTSRNHLAIASGNVVFSEGLTLVNKYTGTTASNRFKVTAATGSSLSISNGLYKCNFTANNDNIKIAGGQFWQYFDPTSMLAEGYIARELTEGDYKYEVVEKPAIVDLQDVSFSLSQTSVNFDGTMKSVTESVTYGGDTLVRGTHYTITEDKLSGVGSAESNTTYAVIITAVAESGYTGAATNEWTIDAPSGSFADDAIKTSTDGCAVDGTDKKLINVTDSTRLVYDADLGGWKIEATVAVPYESMNYSYSRKYYTEEEVFATPAEGSGTAIKETATQGQSIKYVTDIKWTIGLTIADIEAAKGDSKTKLRYEMTAYALANTMYTAGLKPTTYTVVVPLENLVLNDENGDEVYPNNHKHLWGDLAAVGDTLTANCTNTSTECSIESKKITLTLVAENRGWQKATPFEASVTDGFGERIAHEVGEFVYKQNGEMLAAAPILTGEYSVEVTVTVDSVDYTLVKAFAITKPEGGYTEGFEIDGICYDTFADALAAAGNGDTIGWHEEFGNQATFDFTSDKNITIDLCGQTLTYSKTKAAASNLTIVNNGDGIVTLKNGKIVQPKGQKNLIVWYDVYYHVNVSGLFVFDEGMEVESIGTGDDFLVVTASAVEKQPVLLGAEAVKTLKITGGLYKTKFAGDVEITGGNFTEDPSAFFAEGYAIGQQMEDGYPYSVIEHTHTLVYAANGSVITVTCEGEPNKGECFYNNTDVTLTLVAEDAREDKDGNPYAATLNIHDAFETDVTEDDIEYWQGSKKLDAAPTAMGDYEARITVEGQTAVKSFRILDRARTFDVTKISVTGAGDPQCYELAGATLTVTNGGWKYYSADNAPDGSGIEGWYAGLTVTWPNEAFSLSGFNFTAPEFAKFTVDGTDYNGADTIPGIAVKTAGFDLFGLELTQVASFTWYERITVQDVKQAIAASQNAIERQVTAWGEKWTKTVTVLLTETDYGDTDGAAETTFKIVADLNDLTLVDGDGYTVWPEHEHVWAYEANENSITAKCTVVEGPCRYSGYPVWAKIVPTDKVERLCDSTPLTARVDNGVTFAGATDATIGEVEYWQGGKKLDAAPTQPGVYTAKSTVTLEDGTTTYELKMTLTIRAGEVVVDGKHYEKAEDQLERTYQLLPLSEKNFNEPLYISVGKDFAAERTYTIPDATLDIFDQLPMKTLDLAGFTVTGAVDAAVIDNKGKLTICDSSDVETGTLMPDPASDPTTPLLINEKGATLMIDGGTYLGAISNKQGTVSITSGKFLYEPEADWLDDGSYVRQETVGGRKLYVVYPHEHSYTFLQIPLVNTILSATCTARDEGQGILEGSSCKAKEVIMAISMADKDYDGKAILEASGIESWLSGLIPELSDLIEMFKGNIQYYNVTAALGNLNITEFIQKLASGDSLFDDIETLGGVILTREKYEKLTGAEVGDIYFTQEADGSWFAKLLGLTQETRLDEPPVNAGTYNFCVEVEAKRLIGSSERIYTLKKQFKINARPIADATITYTPNSTNLVYIGDNQSYSIKVQVPDAWGIFNPLGQKKTTLVEGEDYTITGTTNATEIGSYSFTVTGIGNYTGSQTVYWQISAPTREFGSNAVVPIVSERGTYAEIDGTAVTVNNSSNLMYDASADAWNLGLVVTWPDGDKKHTQPADAWMKLSTQEGKTYSGEDILGGQTDGEDLTLAKTESDYMKSVTWSVQLTTNDVAAAVAAGETEIVMTLTAGANASNTDPQGLKETEFRLVIPVARIRLYDNEGNRIYPTHLHAYEYETDEEGAALVATCVSEEPGCTIPEVLVSIAAAGPFEYDGTAKEMTLENADAFVLTTGATIGDVVYRQGGKIVDAAILTGVYTAEVEVTTVEDGLKTLVREFEIVEPQGGYTSGFEIERTGVCYETFAEAVAAAKAGDMIVCHVNIDAQTIDFSTDKNVTLDLNGKTLTRTDLSLVGNNDMTISNDGLGTLTIVNGTIKQPKGTVVIGHINISGNGQVVFGEGVVFDNLAVLEIGTLLDDYLKVSVSGGGVTVADGSYESIFSGNVTIKGGQFWSSFNPTPFVPATGYMIFEQSGTYKYKVINHTHDFTYVAEGLTITRICEGSGADPCPEAEIFAKLSITASTGYSGRAVSASVSGTLGYTLAYYIDATPRGAALAGAPIDIGNYIVVMTVGGKSVEATFAIVDPLDEPRAVAIAEIESAAGIQPWSDEMNGLVEEARKAINAATSESAINRLKDEGLSAIAEQHRRESGIMLYPDGDGGAFVSATKSSEQFLGTVIGENGVEGTIDLKVTKPNAKTGLFNVTATVKTLVDEQSYSFKATKVGPAVADEPFVCEVLGSNAKSKAHSLVVSLEGDSLTGSFDDWAIDGAKQVFAISKHPKCDAILPFVGVWTGAFESDAGLCSFSAKLTKAGAATIKVLMPGGKSLSCSTKAEVGADGIVVVPVTVWQSVSGKQRSFGFRLAFFRDGSNLVCEAGDIAPIRDWTKKTGAVEIFAMTEFTDAALLTVTSAEFKTFVTEVDPELEGALAVLGEVTARKDSLKLTTSTGLISGTIKWTVMTVDVKGKSKKMTVSGKASGIMVGEEGFGTLTVKIDGVSSTYAFTVGR